MQLYLTRKSAERAASKRTGIATPFHSIRPFMKLHRDGSATHCYRVALFTRSHTFAGWA